MSGPADPRQDVRARAVHALPRCVAGPPDLPAELCPLALEAIEVLLLAGLPLFDVEAATGDDTGVELFAQEEPGGPVLRLVWRQHPAIPRTGEPWKSVQAAMHRALREVLAAHWLRLRDDGPGDVPTVLSAGHPA